MALDHTTLDEAAGWAVKTSDPGFDDWAGFTAWLEGAPGRAEAYDRVMLAAEESGAALIDRPVLMEVPSPPAPVGVPDAAAGAAPLPSAAPTRLWLAGALAACLAVVAALWIWSLPGSELTYRTGPGETRRIALDDGSAVVLAGDSELVLASEGARRASLVSGRALFEIRHDDADPFRLTVGPATLVDAGTVFDVNIRAGEVAVGVAEGAVIYNPAAQNARIEPGQELVFDRRTQAYRMAAVPPAQVGEWREGRLTFRDQPLAVVAADLARATGIAYRVAAGDGGGRISGSIALSAVRSDPAAIGPLLGVAVDRADTDWVLAAR